MIFKIVKRGDVMAKAKKLPSGNWRVRVYDKETGKYKSFTSDTKKEAEYMAAEWLSDRKREKNEKTVGECIDEYIAAKSNILSPTTIEGYRKIKRCNLSELCDIPISDITANDIQKHINTLSLKLSPKSVRNAHGLLMSIMNVYVPDFRANTTLPQKQKKFKEFPEVKDVLNAIKNTDIELPCLLAIWLGLRMSEIRGIKKSDISGNILTIQRAKVTVKGKHIEKSSTKTFESTRQLAVPEYILQMILNREGEYITEMTGNAIGKRLTRILNTNGLTHITFHDLRHLNASVMLMLGIPDKYAMERGGWSSPNIMKSVYQHTFSEERKMVDKRIND